MKCDKKDCDGVGQLVYCMDFIQKKYHYTKCPYYSIQLKDNKPQQRPMSQDLLDKCRRDEL